MKGLMDDCKDVLLGDMDVLMDGSVAGWFGGLLECYFDRYLMWLC